MAPPTQAPSPRPKFHPRPLSPHASILHSSPARAWQPIVASRAPFPCASFAPALQSLILRPEHSGPLILRAEPLPPPVPPLPASTEMFRGWRPTRVTRRRLMPRVPERDGALDQTCVLYRASGGEEGEMMVLIPELHEGDKLPYYHPDVQRLAMVYRSLPSPRPGSAPTPADGEGEGDDAADASAEQQVFGEIRIEVVLPAASSGPVQPLPAPAPAPVDPNGRLYRTCLSLLETLYKHSWGHYVGYKKRVQHDVLVPKEQYQDLYLRLKQRHKHHVASWTLSTDPRKHVFEVKKAELDVAIGAFLMLLWKQEFPAREEREAPLLRVQGEDEPEWASWGRPEGGFVDLGCGNGLLVHILLQEGYTGCGHDLTARKTWASFPPSTLQYLHTSAISPLSTPPLTPPLPARAFLIGNHADELTPYVPLLATLAPSSSGWLVIPCCPYTFTGRFTAQAYRSRLGGSEVERRMDEGGEGAGRVRAYLVWLEEAGRRMGWEVRVEALRMPSTRNWGLVGRRRRRAAGTSTALDEGDAPASADGLRNAMNGLKLNGDSPAEVDAADQAEEERESEQIVSADEGRRWAEEKLEEVRQAGGFTVREGKGHGH